MTDSVIGRREIVHFAGFEPLDAQRHHERFARALTQSAGAWGFKVEPGGLEADGRFALQAKGDGWGVDSALMIVEHASLIAALTGRSFPRVLLDGFHAAGCVVVQGGLWRYLRVSWRFALFFLFPFLLMGSGLALAGLAAALPLMAGLSPLWLLASLPVALAAFHFGFRPLAARFHTELLFADWVMAVDVAGWGEELEHPLFQRGKAAILAALSREADEHVFASHSMGGAVLLHALGAILETQPDALDGRNVTLVTMGGPGLQCALLSGAKVMRRRIAAILARPALAWIDVQCLTDACSFYKARIARDTGNGHLREPHVTRIRVRDMVDETRYARIKRDMLRIHRQPVLGSDKRAGFDYMALIAGPLPADAFTTDVRAAWADALAKAAG
ncbi:MAG: hypothetical protein MUC58_05630 [Rhizobiaceae bacterium]|jgi:hypothetical protein|nr:hypothetical protein [Rhizobiaceae bacterium]